MKKPFITLFIASVTLGATAQNLTDLKNIVEGTTSERNLLLTQADTTQHFLSLSIDADYKVPPHINNYRLPSTNVGNMGVNYKPLEDLTYVGVPLFVSGIIAKKEKEAFRQDYKNSPANTRLVTSFKTRIDDYTQFLPPLMTVGLKASGVEGRSDWQRLTVSAAMSYALMAGLVNSIKYTASEMRPDGSTANSWPSGHTATAFVGATILHKEYGLTRSPWYSALGYGTATATGIMRVLNNRHWVSDVLSGAGIGIMSGELAYMLSDLIYKDRHLLHGDISSHPDLYRKHPSFFDVSMGIGFGSKDITFPNYFLEYRDDPKIHLKFRSATVVQVEGAYFFNNFIGLGGRLRVRTSSVKGWDNLLKVAEGDAQSTLDYFSTLDDDEDVVVEGKVTDMIESREFTIESDHLTEFAGDAGLYFNIPISKKFAIGTKALIGSSIMQALDIDANFKGKVKGLDYDLSVRDGMIVAVDNMRFYDKGTSYEDKWDYLTVSGNNSLKFGTGLSLSYAYHNNFCWKVFCDFDFTRKTYTLTYNPSHYGYLACPEFAGIANLLAGEEPDEFSAEVKKNMNQFVIGASLSVQF